MPIRLLMKRHLHLCKLLSYHKKSAIQGWHFFYDLSVGISILLTWQLPAQLAQPEDFEENCFRTVLTK